MIAQCDMVHILPCQVSVKDALNSYLENKLVPLREKQVKESRCDGKHKVAMLPFNGKKRTKRSLLGK